ALLPDGRMVAVDWAKAIFSPSFPLRLAHMVLAAYLSTALMVGAASAFALLKSPKQAESRIALRMAVAVCRVVAPLQLFVGDLAGKQVTHTQPAKLAAIEAFWQTRPAQPFHIIAWPDRTIQGNRFEVSVPALGSWITAGSAAASVMG